MYAYKRSEKARHRSRSRSGSAAGAHLFTAPSRRRSSLSLWMRIKSVDVCGMQLLFTYSDKLHVCDLIHHNELNDPSSQACFFDDSEFLTFFIGMITSPCTDGNLLRQSVPALFVDVHRGSVMCQTTDGSSICHDRPPSASVVVR